MAELIDRQTLLETLMPYVQNRSGDIFDAIDEIEAVPAVDAVEVVRCKECGKCLAIKSYSGIWSYDCTYHDMEVNADDYCSYGVRKDNE